MSFTWLEHTSDIRLKLESSSFEELFTDALRAMNELLGPEPARSEPGKTLKREISIEASDITSLLVDFLNAVLLETSIHKTLFSEVVSMKITNETISAILNGTPCRSLTRDIKAVTYHEADVKMNQAGKLETILVFDL
ncbi:MAG: archease [Chlorobiaceae bacterium]|nr:archease [Chlorobiaceae bacterium]